MRVFVLCTGRCGSVTFSKACGHMTNFTCGHESRTRKVGDDRLLYPDHHIEVDNRLSWFLGRLDALYGDDAFFVHLVREPEATAASYLSRYASSTIMTAYASGILMGTRVSPEEISRDYVETVSANISHYLDGKSQSRVMTVRLEQARADFARFWAQVGAEGDLEAASREWETFYNKQVRAPAPTRQPAQTCERVASIHQESPMLIVGFGRGQMLSALPKGGIVAEVGVFRGRFSSSILDVVAPETLHLIDPWLIESGSTNAEGAQMPEAYEEVLGRFKQQSADGTVVLHRDYSVHAATLFPDEHFDWVYVDAMHDYENVLADLQAFDRKVKPDGFVLGHDFSNHEHSRRHRFGVIPAVLEYSAEAGMEIVAMTNEDHPSYMLARRDNETTLPTMRAKLLEIGRTRPVEIHPSLLRSFDQVETYLGGERKGKVIRFGYRGS